MAKKRDYEMDKCRELVDAVAEEFLALLKRAKEAEAVPDCVADLERFLKGHKLLDEVKHA